ncbi:MAG: signal peptidase I, partial [Clostridiales bacterium]|nr:signal peptidase I [Clostridiales bacterium]
MRKAFAYTGLALLLLILILLTVNAMFSIFMPHYYPTFGGYRLFSIVSDSMDPTIPKGHMIVCKKPTSEDEIKEGTVITFEITDKDGNIKVNTHRVQKVTKHPTTGKTSYTTKGDNAPLADSVHPEYSDVIGIYTGQHCAFFGYFFGFMQSTQGAITLILVLFIVLIAWIVIEYVRHHERRKKLENAALKKGAQELSNVNLRYDNIREITAVMDVLGMVTEEPKNRAENKDIESRLGEFIDAESIELPQTPETAAVLDSLPAPDTPMTLAAALRNGATLRQAEDGQTLVLTGLSGGKSILLTPVQTPDGIILCQQGVRLRSDIAPNIESVGATSMPEYPEFFEGQPLEKN